MNLVTERMTTDQEYKELAQLLGAVFVKKTRTVKGVKYVSRCLDHKLSPVKESAV